MSINCCGNNLVAGWSASPVTDGEIATLALGCVGAVPKDGNIDSLINGWSTSVGLNTFGTSNGCLCLAARLPSNPTPAAVGKAPAAKAVNVFSNGCAIPSSCLCSVPDIVVAAGNCIAVSAANLLPKGPLATGSKNVLATLPPRPVPTPLSTAGPNPAVPKVNAASAGVAIVAAPPSVASNGVMPPTKGTASGISGPNCAP